MSDMTASTSMSHHEAAASIVAAARTSLPDLVERVAHRIRTEIPCYAAEDVVAPADLRSSVRANLDYILDGLTGPARANLSAPDATSTFFPSGLQPTTVVPSGCHVIRRATPPLDGITYTSVLPSRCAEYAICDPSGEKNGPAVTCPFEVSRCASPPCRFTVHTSSAYRNAILSCASEGLRSSSGASAPPLAEPP